MNMSSSICGNTEKDKKKTCKIIITKYPIYRLRNVMAGINW